MRFFLNVAVFLAFGFWTLVASSEVKTKRQQMIAFEAIVAELQDQYGMSPYKEANFGVTIEAAAARYRKLISEARTLEEDAGLEETQKRSKLSPEQFLQLMIGFAAEFKDGHTNITRQSKFASTLGIRTASIDDRLYVVGFVPDLFIPGSIPELQIGDEIISVDGKPVQELAQRNFMYTQQFGATYNTAKGMALRFVLNVPHALFQPKPEGAAVQVEFKRPGEKTTFKGSYHWIHSNRIAEAKSVTELLKPTPMFLRKPMPYVYGDSSHPESYFSQGLKNLQLGFGGIIDIATLINVEIAKNQFKAMAAGPVGHSMRSGKPIEPQGNYPPEMAKLLSQLKPVNRIPVYSLRLVTGQTVGVIRIPNYMPEDMMNELNWIQVAIQHLENSVDVLIIDQLANGGGSVFHAGQFLKFLGSTTLDAGQINMRLSEALLQNLENALYLQENRPADPDDQTGDLVPKQNFAQAHLQRDAVKRLRAMKEAGHKWSGPVANILGDLQLLQNEAGVVIGKVGRTFTKPMIVLNDHDSASAGDIVPWILQGSKRAVVMGEPSMGLGGPVFRSHDSMPGSELQMRCAFGVCTNDKGEAVENIGVIPDILREVTYMDMQNGFRMFANDVLMAASLVAQGADAAQINAGLEKSQYMEGRLQAPMGLIQQLRQVEASIVTSLSQAEGDFSTQKQILERYFEGLKTIPAKIYDDITWEAFKTPLPTWLTANDPILRSLRKAPEIRERLRTLQKIRTYSQGESEVVAALLKGLDEMYYRRNPELEKLAQPRACGTVFIPR